MVFLLHLTLFFNLEFVKSWCVSPDTRFAYVLFGRFAPLEEEPKPKKKAKGKQNNKKTNNKGKRGGKRNRYDDEYDDYDDGYDDGYDDEYADSFEDDDYDEVIEEPAEFLDDRFQVFDVHNKVPLAQYNLTFNREECKKNFLKNFSLWGYIVLRFCHGF